MEKREWADVYGEPVRSGAQLHAEETFRRDQGSRRFTVELTGDEVAWLVDQVLPNAATFAAEHGPYGQAKEVDDFRIGLLDELYEQGYRVL